MLLVKRRNIDVLNNTFDLGKRFARKYRLLQQGYRIITAMRGHTAAKIQTERLRLRELEPVSLERHGPP